MVTQDAGQTNVAVKPHKMNPLGGLGALVGIIAIISGFVALSGALQVGELNIGFLFLFYWGAIESVAAKRVLPSALGAFAGLGLAFLPHFIVAPLGSVAMPLYLAVLLVVVYFMIMKWLPFVINNAMMLFLTVGTISHLQAHGDVRQMFESLGLSVVYFAGIILLLMQIGKLVSKRKAKS